VFNFSGSEVIFLLILGLVVLGPEKLPGVLRKAGRLYGEFKRVTSDAQSELRQALDQPIREIQSTAKTYQGFFVDAAKEVTKDPVAGSSSPSNDDTATPISSTEPDSVPAIDPQFIPYQSPVEAIIPEEEDPVSDPNEGGRST
jgi:Tat protein translocase TatB subunit